MGLSLSLDSKLNPESFESALRTFLHLKSTKTTTDVILLGFSSPSKISIGQDVWEGAGNTSELHGRFPELKQFNDNVAPEEIAICALLEIEEGPNGPVVVSGSPPLADQARATTNTEVDVVGGGPHSSRCATARIQGTGAIEVATAVVAAYGQYVKKLFDNFASRVNSLFYRRWNRTPVDSQRLDLIT